MTVDKVNEDVGLEVVLMNLMVELLKFWVGKFVESWLKIWRMNLLQNEKVIFEGSLKHKIHEPAKFASKKWKVIFEGSLKNKIWR